MVLTKHSYLNRTSNRRKPQPQLKEKNEPQLRLSVGSAHTQLRLNLYSTYTQRILNWYSNVYHWLNRTSATPQPYLKAIFSTLAYGQLLPPLTILYASVSPHPRSGSLPPRHRHVPHVHPDAQVGGTPERETQAGRGLGPADPARIPWIPWPVKSDHNGIYHGIWYKVVPPR